MKVLKKISIWVYIISIIVIVLVLVVLDIITNDKLDSGWENIPCLEGMSCLDDSNKEKFMLGATVDDGRVIHFTFDVPYSYGNTNSYVMTEITNNKLTIEEFVSNLSLIDNLKDGGSQIYKYNENKKIYGNDEFYVIKCNSIDGIKDVYVAKYRESLNDKCSIKINDLDGVSMIIKDGTLTRKGTTVIITDTSDRENIYGTSYRIDKKVNNKWVELEPIIENYAFTSIGYSVDENNKLELDVDWNELYGELKNGEYRIVKDTSETGEGTSHYITTEFVIK